MERFCVKCGVNVPDGSGRELTFKRTRKNKRWEVNILLCGDCTDIFEERLKQFVEGL